MIMPTASMWDITVLRSWVIHHSPEQQTKKCQSWEGALSSVLIWALNHLGNLFKTLLWKSNRPFSREKTVPKLPKNPGSFWAALCIPAPLNCVSLWKEKVTHLIWPTAASGLSHFICSCCVDFGNWIWLLVRNVARLRGSLLLLP